MRAASATAVEKGVNAKAIWGIFERVPVRPPGATFVAPPPEPKLPLRVRVEGRAHDYTPPVLGERRGSLVVRKLLGRDKYRHPVVRCECDCGKLVTRGIAGMVGEWPKCSRYCRVAKRRQIEARLGLA